MKKLIFVLALLCAPFTLYACATPPSAVLASTTVDEQALVYAGAAKLGADATALEAVRQGLIEPGSPQAIKIADTLQGAQNALDLAWAAQRVGQEGTAAQQLQFATALITAALAAIPEKKK